MSMHYEEFEVGQIITTPGRTIIDADLMNFAGMTGDYTPLHTDAVFAASTPFGGLIAHGPMLIGMGFGLGARAGVFGSAVLGLLGVQWEFHAPVRPGDTVHAEIEITDKRTTQKPGRGVVGFRIDLKNQAGVQVQTGRAQVMIKQRD